ncbi:GreA/GreB family elongation factor [Pseudocitrobacter faecalis]
MCRAYYARKNLVYPNEVKSNDDISIFAPVGSALLGLAAGQTLTWPMPGGAEKPSRSSKWCTSQSVKVTLAVKSGIPVQSDHFAPGAIYASRISFNSCSEPTS